MKKLFLFDIDNTLITNVSEKSFATPIKNLHDLDVDVSQDFSGLTDQLILAKLLRTVGWDDALIEMKMPALIKELEYTYISNFNKDSIALISGVKDLLQVLEDKGHVLGLITGNLKAIAKVKLEAVGIYSYFTVGAYADDSHSSRAELVSAAVERAGYTSTPQDVYVFGDTVLDIEASLGAGIKNAVGVSNGFRSTEELKSSGASIVFVDFKDLGDVTSQLGV